MTQYPQVLINVQAPHDLQARKALLHDAALLEAKAKAEATLGKEDGFWCAHLAQRHSFA